MLLDHAKSTRKNLREEKFPDRFFGKIPTFSSGISCKKIFTTFCHQKVVPKVSAGRKSRGTADGLRLKRYADELAPAFFRRRIRRPFFFPIFRNAETVMRSTQRRLFIPLIEERQSAAVRCGGLHLVSAARKASSAGRELTDKTDSRTTVRQIFQRPATSRRRTGRRLRPQRPARRCPPRTPTGRCAMVNPYVGIPEGFLFGMINPNF